MIIKIWNVILTVWNFIVIYYQSGNRYIPNRESKNKNSDNIYLLSWNVYDFLSSDEHNTASSYNECIWDH